ncbi:MAG: hypothetical protein ACLFST_09850 [Spirochaetia bacterium]
MKSKRWKTARNRGREIKTLFPLSVIGLLIIFLAPGCGREEPVILEAPVEIPESESITIQWLGPLDWSIRDHLTEGGTTWFQDHIQKLFNVTIQPAMYGDSKDIWEIWPDFYGWEPSAFPDCGIIFLSQGDTESDPEWFYKSGLIRTIPEKMIREHMPRFTAYMETMFPHSWNELDPPAGLEGEYLKLITVNMGKAVPTGGVSVHRHTMESLGFSLDEYNDKSRLLYESGNTSITWIDADLSLEWWEGFLKAYIQESPRGHIAWPAPQNEWDQWWDIGLRGVTGRVDGVIEQNGTLALAPISENYKKYLILLQNWYNQGLIDLYFGTHEFERMMENYREGKIAVSPFTLNEQSFFEQTITMLQHSPAGPGGNNDIVVFPPITGPGGQGIYTGKAISSFQDDMHTEWAFFVGAGVSDKKLARILMIWDYLNFGDTEPYVYARWGKPGTHFTWSGAQWNSRPLRVEPGKKDFVPGPAPFLLPRWWMPEHFIFACSPLLAEFIEHRRTDPAVVSSIDYPAKIDVTENPSFNAVHSKYAAGLFKLSYNLMVDVVREGRDIEAVWDTYRTNYLHNGGVKLLDAYKWIKPVEEYLRDGILYY